MSVSGIANGFYPSTVSLLMMCLIFYSQHSECKFNCQVVRRWYRCSIFPARALSMQVMLQCIFSVSYHKDLSFDR